METKTDRLRLLTVLIPARDEEECVASTVEQLNLELRLNQIPHEIVVVDDGSSDRDGCQPLIAPHFNLTVEIPLKAIVRGFSWTVIPITWRNR